jgi:hypothetical protein
VDWVKRWSERDGSQRKTAASCFSFASPCFVLICPRDAMSNLQPLFLEMLETWNFACDTTIQMHSLPIELHEDKTLLEIAKMSDEDLTRKTRLCLRSASLWEKVHHAEVKELVEAAPKIQHIDFGYNQLGGQTFFDWTLEWLKKDRKNRTVDVGGIYNEEMILQKARELKMEMNFKATH